MADYCVALNSIESARTHLREAMTRAAWATLLKRAYLEEHGDYKPNVLQFWKSVNIINAMNITAETWNPLYWLRLALPVYATPHFP
jgi:hypothetical protein